MKNSFFGNSRALLTVMVLAKNAGRIKELVKASLAEGAEAFGMQFEVLCPEERREDVYRELFDCTGDKPVYVTNYRYRNNTGKTDDMLARELLSLAECGADLCDIMGDYFDPQPGEFTDNPNAVEKQKKLIEAVHGKGSKVLMSSHILKYTPAERVLEIALGQQSRGADICKIVTGAETEEQEIENLKIIRMLKHELNIPFLFLSTGKCGIMRRIGGELGCFMYLTVHEYDECAAKLQPLLKDEKIILELLRNDAIEL